MIGHLTAVWKFRHFLLALVRLDLRLRYRRSVLGVGWSLLNPIAMTVVFTVVFSKMLGSGAWEYAPMLLTGMAVWNFLKEAGTTGSRALITNESYIRQSPLPYTLYPLRTVFGQAIHAGISLLVVVVLLVIIQQSARPLLVFPAVIPGLVLAFLAAWAVATITAFVNVYFHDTQHMLEVAAQIGFFLTPIIYTREVLDKQQLGWVVDLNPVNLFLDLIRAPLLTGEPPALNLYLAAAAVTAGLGLLAAGTTAWLQKRVVFHL
ncbi:MAG TPA: ABC transporter permease [Urbifossiella sp.]|jgi:ABC-type polysaccharide/polyol phosphate export permease|nr:ABC transporter permease [Urbifossiella sp.]